MYKGFDLSVFMNFSYGNKVFNMSTQRFIGPYLPNCNTLQDGQPLHPHRPRHR